MEKIEKELIALALAEDIGTGDITSDLLETNLEGKAEIYANQEAILCGLEYVNTIAEIADIEVNWLAKDGDQIFAKSKVAAIHGKFNKILTYERSILNFLQTLSGTATVVRKASLLFKDSNICILDTRKTIPGLRFGQKYAVTVGGGHNHRKGLYDQYLIKENHIKAYGNMRELVNKARSENSEVVLEIEVENLEEFAIACSLDVDIIMLDNFSIENIKKAILLKPSEAKFKIEVSGNYDLSNIELVNKMKKLSIDYISAGGLTKNIAAIDFSMKIV